MNILTITASYREIVKNLLDQIRSNKSQLSILSYDEDYEGYYLENLLVAMVSFQYLYPKRNSKKKHSVSYTLPNPSIDDTRDPF